MWRAAIVVLTIMLVACHHQTGSIRPESWKAYRDSFISADGRVIDNVNGNISHSEGQGYAMLLAVAADDRKAFDRLWHWTAKHLAIRPDGLLAWKWVPGTNNPVPDSNNATDGDILVAWALGRASRQFGEEVYGEAATAMAKAIRSRLARNSEYGVLLLPGAEGFESDTGVVVNPSYMILPAYRELALWDAPQFWKRLENENRRFLNVVIQHFNGLPPDWLMLSDKQMGRASNADLKFGYDALRLPLYVCWQGDETQVSLAGIAQRWHSATAPAWISLDSDTVSKTPLTNAHLAMRWLLAQCLPQREWSAIPQLPAKTDDYYGATLKLLATLAWSERND